MWKVFFGLLLVMLMVYISGLFPVHIKFVNKLLDTNIPMKVRYLTIVVLAYVLYKYMK